jgi:hypothetical protein
MANISTGECITIERTKFNNVKIVQAINKGHFIFSNIFENLDISFSLLIFIKKYYSEDTSKRWLVVVATTLKRPQRSVLLLYYSHIEEAGIEPD